MKTLVKEIAFGKAKAIITVKSFEEVTEMNQINTITTTEVKVIKDGKVLDTGLFAKISNYDSNPKWFDKMGLKKDQLISRVGENAITLGAEAGKEINEMIEEMKAELNNDQTQEKIKKEEKAKENQAIINQAKKEGIRNLMTNEELKSWRVRYNNIHNEGGEGYIPTRITKEQYQKAVQGG
jgi:hypothetical protein